MPTPSSSAVPLRESLFRKRVMGVVRAIPKGSVMTYAEVARKAGSPGAARAVGTLMKGNFDRNIPCHRVVRSDGIIGDYNRGGALRKQAILKREGVKFSGNRVIR